VVRVDPKGCWKKCQNQGELKHAAGDQVTIRRRRNVSDYRLRVLINNTHSTPMFPTTRFDPLCDCRHEPLHDWRRPGFSSIISRICFGGTSYCRIKQCSWTEWPCLGEACVGACVLFLSRERQLTYSPLESRVKQMSSGRQRDIKGAAGTVLHES
jgi:hypothetical protein